MKRQKIQRQPMSLEKAKSIGILFDKTSSEENLVFVRHYAQLLRKKGKQVECLAYIGEVPPTEEAAYQQLSRKEVNWYFQPKGQAAETFINTPFDILLCLVLTPNLPLEYIAALSPAHLRVGKYDQAKTHCFDLMIDNPASTDLENFIGQMDKYLNLIK